MSGLHVTFKLILKSCVRTVLSQLSHVITSSGARCDVLVVFGVDFNLFEVLCA